MSARAALTNFVPDGQNEQAKQCPKEKRQTNKNNTIYKLIYRVWTRWSAMVRGSYSTSGTHRVAIGKSWINKTIFFRPIVFINALYCYDCLVKVTKDIEHQI